MATCPYLELVLLPGGLGRYHTYTCCNTPSLLILCSILFNLPSAVAKFFELPFFSPHLLLFIFSQTWGQPAQHITWMCLGGPSSPRVSRAVLQSLWLCPSGQRLCGTQSCREVWLGTSLPTLSLSLGSREQLLSVQHFSILLPNPSR